MTLTYISCSSDFYTFYVNVTLSLGCMIGKVSAEDIAIRGNGTGLEYMCPTRHFVYIFFNPVFQVSTAKNEINLFNNHVLIVAPVTFAPAGAMTPSAEFLLVHQDSSSLHLPSTVNLGPVTVQSFCLVFQKKNVSCINTILSLALNKCHSNLYFTVQ